MEPSGFSQVISPAPMIPSFRSLHSSENGANTENSTPDPLVVVLHQNMSQLIAYVHHHKDEEEGIKKVA